MAATSKIDNDLPPLVWEKIYTSIRNITYGSITIIVQDGRVIQIEINEKIRFPFTDGNGNSNGASPKSGQKTATHIETEIKQSLVGLQYGQLIILIKDGKVTQIDRTEKKRLPHLEGINGEGI